MRATDQLGAELRGIPPFVTFRRFEMRVFGAVGSVGVVGAALLLVACGGDDSPPPGGTGGSVATGGAGGTGGEDPLKVLWDYVIL